MEIKLKCMHSDIIKKPSYMQKDIKTKWSISRKVFCTTFQRGENEIL